MAGGVEVQRTTIDSKREQHSEVTDACRQGRGVGGGPGSWLGKNRRQQDGHAVYWELFCEMNLCKMKNFRLTFRHKLTSKFYLHTPTSVKRGTAKWEFLHWHEDCDQGKIPQGRQLHQHIFPIYILNSTSVPRGLVTDIASLNILKSNNLQTTASLLKSPTPFQI